MLNFPAPIMGARNFPLKGNPLYDHCGMDGICGGHEKEITAKNRKMRGISQLRHEFRAKQVKRLSCTKLCVTGTKLVSKWTEISDIKYGTKRSTGCLIPVVASPSFPNPTSPLIDQLIWSICLMSSSSFRHPFTYPKKNGSDARQFHRTKITFLSFYR